MQSLGLLFVRLSTGLVFLLHGIPKLIGGEGTSAHLSEDQKRVLGEGFASALEHGGVANTAKMLEGMGVSNPQPMAIALGATEAAGGLALILGIKSRPAAIALATSQLVAIAKVHGKNGLIADGGYEKNLVLLGASIGIALAGPGKLAKD
jgi:uncharacterized membrane protein YphA (DoxX/SURF4 family)